MSTNYMHILGLASNLSETERAKLIIDLVETLPQELSIPNEVVDNWIRKSKSKIAAIKDGNVKGLSLAEFKMAIYAKL